jgi:very-short-patch-repair endonuclease
MGYSVQYDAISKARSLRHDPTPVEKKLWEKIRKEQLGVRFRRQVPIGPYFADFACIELKLVVEVDGATHSESQTDVARTNYLTGLGFEVVRFWNNDVLNNIEGVVENLTQVISEGKNKQG